MEREINFRFCDSMGLEGGEAGLSHTDVAKILDGYVRDLAEVSLQFLRFLYSKQTCNFHINLGYFTCVK